MPADRRESDRDSNSLILEKLDSIEERFDLRLTALQATDARIEKKLDDYVTKAEFKPVQTIVFGMVGVILTAALLTLLQRTGITAKSAEIITSVF